MTSHKDDGTAWLVALSSHGIHVLTYGVVWSSAVFYLIFLDAFQQSQETTSLVGSLMTATLYASGPLSGFLCKRLGCRRVIFLGGLLAGLGLVLSSIVTDIHQLFATYSIISGLGFGLASITSVFSVPQHFDKKRTVALGVVASGVGVGTVVYPPILGTLVDKYSWRGVLLLCGGLTFNICVFALTISPPESKTPGGTVAIVADGKRPKKTNVLVEDSRKILHLFKKSRFVAMAFNNLLYCFALIIVHIHISAFLKFNFGMTSTTNSGMFVSILGVCNLIGRSALGLICHLTSAHSGCLYAITHLVSTLAVFLLPAIDNVIFVACCCAVFGFCSASIGTLMPDILADMFDNDHFGYAYGFTLIFEAVGTLTGGPVSGWLLDNFKDYSYLFFLAAAINLLSVAIFVSPNFRHPSKIFKNDMCPNLSCTRLLNLKVPGVSEQPVTDL